MKLVKVGKTYKGYDLYSWSYNATGSVHLDDALYICEPSKYLRKKYGNCGVNVDGYFYLDINKTLLDFE